MGSLKIISTLAGSGLLAAMLVAFPARAQAPSASELSAACAAQAQLPVPGDPVGKAWKDMDAAAAMDACDSAVEADPYNLDNAPLIARALFKGGERGLALDNLAVSPASSLQAKYLRAMSQLVLEFMPTHEQVDGARNASDARNEPQPGSSDNASGGSTDAFLRGMTEAAEAGYVPAQIALGKYRIGALGRIYAEDLDPIGAAERFRAAAAQGSAEGKFWLAYTYRYGVGSVVDPAEAARLYRESADAGYAPAMVAMGNLYMDGFGVPLNLETASEWFYRAAEAGDDYGAYFAAVAYERRGSSSESVLGVIEDAALAGNASAQVELADRIVESDPERARDLYRKAEAQGHVGAPFNALIETKGHRSALAITQGFQNLLTMTRVYPALAQDPYTLFYGLRLDKSQTERLVDRLTAVVGRLEIPLAKALAAKKALDGRPMGLSRADAVANLRLAAESGDLGAAVTLAFPPETLGSDVLAPVEREKWRTWLAALEPAKQKELADALSASTGSGQDFGLVLTGVTTAATLDDVGRERGVLQTLGKFRLFPLALERAVALVSSPQFAALSVQDKASVASALADGLQSACAWRASVSAFVQQAHLLKEATACNDQSPIFSATPEQLETLFGAGISPAGLQLAYLRRSGETGSVDNPGAAAMLQRVIDDCLTRRAARQTDEWDEYSSSSSTDVKRACDGQTRFAKIMLASLYEKGEGVPRDLNRALELYREGAMAGRSSSGTGCFDCRPSDPVAAGGLLRAYMAGVLDLRPEDARTIASYAERTKDPTILRTLGMMYLRGAAVARDPAQAARWIQAGALSSDGEAQLNLAMLYEKGIGVKRDPATAARWFAAAAASGFDKDTQAYRTMSEALAEYPVEGSQADLGAMIAAVKDEADQAFERGNFTTALQTNLDRLAEHSRLMGDSDEMVATRLKALSVGDAMLIETHGSMDNYFALLNSSCHWGRASLEAYNAGRPEAALYFAKASVNKLQDARRFINQLDKNLRECFLQVHQDRYRWLADLLMEMGRYPEAEQVLGMLKDFEFKEFANETRSGAQDTLGRTRAESEIFDRYASMSEDLIKANRTALQLGSKPRSQLTPEEQEQSRLAQAVINDARTSYLTHFEALKDEMRALDADAPARRAGGEEQIASVTSDWESGANETMRRELTRRGFGNDTAALHAVVTPTRVHWLLTTPLLQRAIPINISQSDLERDVLQMRVDITRRDPNVAKSAAALYRKVFAPVDEELKQLGISTVLVSLDGILRYVPLAALNDGNDWLTRRYAFSAFRDVQYLEGNPVDRGEWNIAAFGVTERSVTPSGVEFEALPAVAGELEAIAGPGNGIVDNGQIALNKAFDGAALADALEARTPIIHIATHFNLAPTAADSILLLGGNQELKLETLKTDGRFSFLDVDLLVLSACQTAVSSGANAGSELDSMGQVAQDRGAASVLASLWKVDDGSTASLMHEFYANKIGKGLSKSEALRQVQLAFLDRKITRTSPAGGDRAPTAEREGGPTAAASDWDHPYYWAAFLLMGNVS